MIYHIEQTTSTNDDAREERYRHGDVVWAERQTAGRGQRGNTWTSPEGENLTFTLVLEPAFLPAADQFLLLQAVTLALTDTFADFGIDTRIKWTNDIYAGDRKLVGILIEHSYSGTRLARTVVGVGINVNQTAFDPSLPNPVSMAQAAGRTFDRGEVLESFVAHAMERYAQTESAVRSGRTQEIRRLYRERMYRLGERQMFRLGDRHPLCNTGAPSCRALFEAVVEGVAPSGALRLRHGDGTLGEYLFREVEFVIKN